MKKLLISALVIGAGLILQAQQIPQVSHFMYDQLRTNPASAGSLDMVCITGVFKEDLAGFPGNPDNFFLNAGAPFSLGNTKHGAGLTIYRDNIGFYTDISLMLSYAFRFSLGDGTLGIGLNAGVLENNLDAEWVTQDQETDFNIPTGDGAENPAFTLGAGLFYRTDEIYFGASVLNLNQPQVSYIPSEGESPGAYYNLSRHYYVTAGYNMQLPNPAWELRPAVLLKSDVRSTDMDLNLTCLYNKKIWAGVTYRTGEAVVGMIGFEVIEGLKVGYSYDFQTSALINYSQGTHEIMANYCFKIGVEKAPQKYKSIRFL